MTTAQNRLEKAEEWKPRILTRNERHYKKHEAT
jgi:hypothetical protein